MTAPPTPDPVEVEELATTIRILRALPIPAELEPLVAEVVAALEDAALDARDHADDLATAIRVLHAR